MNENYVIDVIANLARRVASLESQLRDTQGNVEKLAEELADAKYNAKRHIENITCDISTLDERTQVINAINKFYEEGRR
jgi:predicted  nucleic acid-binding Zn-ribbon protein